MLILCLQITLLQIVLVLRKNAYATENVRNVLNIIRRKVKSPIVQDDRFKNQIFSVLLNIAKSEQLLSFCHWLMQTSNPELAYFSKRI